MADCICTQEKRLKAIEERQTKATKEREAMTDSLEKIEGALLGDQYHPEGMVKKQEKQEQKIDRIEKLLQGVKYWIIGAGAVISAGIVIATLIARFK